MEKDNKKFNLSNLVTTSLLTGLLAIGAAHSMENKKRTEVEENLLSVVNDLVVWHKQRTELADENTKVIKYLSGLPGVSLRAAEVGVLFTDDEFRERIKHDGQIHGALSVAMEFEKYYGLQDKEEIPEGNNTAWEKMIRRLINSAHFIDKDRQLEEQFRKDNEKKEEQ